MAAPLPARPQLPTQDSYLSVRSGISDGNEPLHLPSDIFVPSLRDFIASTAPVPPAPQASSPLPNTLRHAPNIYIHNLFSMSQNAVDLDDRSHQQQQFIATRLRELSAGVSAPKPLTVRKASLQRSQTLPSRKPSMAYDQYSPMTRSRTGSESSLYAPRSSFQSEVRFVTEEHLPSAAEYSPDEFSPTAEVFQNAVRPSIALPRSPSPLLPHEHVAKYKQGIKEREEMERRRQNNDSGHGSFSVPTSHTRTSNSDSISNEYDDYLGSPGPSVEDVTLQNGMSPKQRSLMPTHSSRSASGGYELVSDSPSTLSIDAESGSPHDARNRSPSRAISTNKTTSSRIEQQLARRPSLGISTAISTFSQQIDDTFTTPTSSAIPSASRTPKTSSFFDRLRLMRSKDSSRDPATPNDQASPSRIISGDWSGVESSISPSALVSARSSVGLNFHPQSCRPEIGSPITPGKKKLGLFRRRQRGTSKDSSISTSAASSRNLASPVSNATTRSTKSSPTTSLALLRTATLRRLKSPNQDSPWPISSPLPGSLRTGEVLEQQGPRTLKERREEAKREKARDELKKKIRLVREVDGDRTKGRRAVALCGNKKGKKLVSRDKKTGGPDER